MDIEANVSFFFSPGCVFTLFWKLMLKCTWNKRKLFIEMHYKNTADIFGGFLFLSHRLICGLHSTIYSTYICFITIYLYATANCENYFCVLYKLSVAGLHEVNISHIWGTGDKCHHLGLFLRVVSLSCVFSNNKLLNCELHNYGDIVSWAIFAS